MIDQKWLSIFLGVFVASITGLFLWMAQVDPFILLVGVSSSFIATGLIGYIMLDFFIFKEINDIHDQLKRLKIRTLGVDKKAKNPIKKISQDLTTYASRKENEISDLKKTERFRREFLANVSHELKTPIFAAQGFVHTLIDGAKDDLAVRDKFLQKAAKSLDGLDILVKDLVTLTQMESGDLKMEQKRVDIWALAHETKGQLEQKAAQKGIKIMIKPEQSQAIWVRADTFRIGQVFTNLIDNSIKYGNENGATKVIFEDEPKTIKITISDNGPGIAPDHLPRIFERFYRIEKSRSRELGGTGLGLAIVKHILAGHGTKIKVKSSIGEGTSFEFKLRKDLLG